jgi:hypothetical protein
MVRTATIASIQNPALRRAAEQLDKQAGVGDKDGVVSSAEVDKALKAAEADSSRFDDIAALKTLKTFLAHGGAGGAAPSAGHLGGGGFSPLDLRTTAMTGGATQLADPVLVGEPAARDGVSETYRLGHAEQKIDDKQSVLVPLQGGEIHLIEIEYQDTRKLRDLELNYRDKGSWEWKTFRGDQWFEMEKREKAGEVDIKREPDHNAPWVNNPVRVTVEVLYPDGKVHNVGDKFLDFHIHDAYSPEASGYREKDNISNSYERLPQGKLPEGCMLRLTPYFSNKKPWESERTTAAEVFWVKPTYVPDHAEKVRVSSSWSFNAPRPEGYDVDPDRKIAGVMVRWTDHGKPYSGNIAMDTDSGPWTSPSHSVGSGETKLFPVDGYATGGKIFVEGHGVDVADIDVLYAE